MPLLVITGPTASGKTARAVDCARRFGGEIVSADSRQLYRGMDIGTGKDIEEYGHDVAVHLIDIVPAGYKYNLFEYLRDADSAITDIESRSRLPILCGGTGLYVESVINGLRLPPVPENTSLRADLAGKTLNELTGILGSMKTLHNVTDVDTAQRAIRAIEIATYYEHHPDLAAQAKPHKRNDVTVVGLEIDRENRRDRITDRLHQRLHDGMIEEVESLLRSGIPPEDLIYYGLEYKFITLYLTDAMSRKEMIDGLEIAIHQFAKRQMTWFRGMERRGIHIDWLPWDMPHDEFVDRVAQLLAENTDT